MAQTAATNSGTTGTPPSYNPSTTYANSGCSANAYYFISGTVTNAVLAAECSKVGNLVPSTSFQCSGACRP